MKSTYGFIGLGLIGGSIAKGLKIYEPDCQIMAYMRTRKNLEIARGEGVVDRILTGVTEELSACDVIFLCTPVEYNADYLSKIRPFLKEGAFITDVGSTKTAILRTVNELGMERVFIGGHPMAGSEKSGFVHSSDYLLENAYFFITPVPESSAEIILFYEKLVRAIHAIPLVISPEEHDRIVAGVSHLPHIIASSLVNTVKHLDQEEEYMRMVAAGGFRDITRIASSSPDVWEQICLSNKEAILNSLDSYIRMMETMRDCVRDEDGPALHKLFTSSRDYRDSLDDTKRGSVSRQFLLYVDICDEPGGIATITTLMAMSGINIQNIGILHNREFEEGVLRIEFYEEEARNQAEELLLKRNYSVRKKS